MRYTRKTKRPRRFGRKKRGYKSKFSVAKTLRRHSRQLASRFTYSRYSYQLSTNVSANYHVMNLTDCPLWTAIFDNAGAASHYKKHQTVSCTVDSYVRANTESASITYSYFLVSLKPGTGAKGLVELAGENLTGLIDGTHYTLMTSGQVLLNLKFFNVIQAKRFTVGQDTAFALGVTGTFQPGTYKRWYKKVKWSKSLTDSDHSDVTAIPGYSVPLGTRLYAILFNNNSAADLQYPSWDVNAVWTIKT